MPPQVPFTQFLPPQQSALLLQDSPSGRQAAHMPATQNFPPAQQDSGPVQGPPTGEQQNSPLHMLPEQQAALPPPQSSPGPEQCWQVPPLQMLEQQSLARVQDSLSSTHWPHLLL